MIGRVPGRRARMMIGQMGVADALLMRMVGIVCMRVLKRRLSERKQQARNHSEMESLPHRPLVYTVAGVQGCPKVGELQLKSESASFSVVRTL